MSKTQSSPKRIMKWTIYLIGIWFSCSFTHAQTLNTLFDKLLKDAEQSRPIDTIFNGQTSVENLYTKSLKLARSQKNQVLTNSIQEISNMLSKQNNVAIKWQDILNIIYDSSIANDKISSAKYFLDKNSLISSAAIEASYKNLSNKITICKDKINTEEISCIKQRISKEYYMLEQNDQAINSFKKENFGEDLFTNGSLEDSSYDIMIDIQNIGNLLFTSFISPTETLFYRFPGTLWLWDNNKKKIANNDGANNGTDNLGSFSGSISSGNTDTNSWTTRTIQTPKIDPALDKFILNTTTRAQRGTTTTTKTTSINTNTISTIAQGNICLTPVTENISQTTSNTETITAETIKEYLDLIDSNNQTENIGNTYVPKPITTPTINNIINTWEMNQLIEQQIQTIFDKESTAACTQKCNDKWFRDQVICKLECLCFSVQYPEPGENVLEGTEWQAKLRFCTIPVEQNRISKQKDILWWDDSLSRIKSVFENLLNGWEMIKYDRPKEYLDNQLSQIEWDKYISFDIKIYIKSLFSTVANKARTAEALNQLRKTETKSKWITNDNSLLLSDKTENTQIQNEIQTAISKIAKQTSQNKKSIIFNEKMNEFLQKNSTFWFNVSEEINTFNWLSNKLKNNINALP